MKLKPEFADRAKAFMSATCHLNSCRFPDCIGKSNICNNHGESVAGLFAEHDRRVTELLDANNHEVERRRAAETEVGRLRNLLLKFAEDAHLGALGIDNAQSANDA